MRRRFPARPIPRHPGILIFMIALGGCVGSHRDDGYRWFINHNERGVLLVHGVPGSDDIDYSLTCSDGRLSLDYAVAEAQASYGTVYQTTVGIATGGRTRTVPALARFDEGGSPRIEATIDDPAALLRDMMVARSIGTTDRWSRHVAPAPPPATIAAFATRCGVAVR